MTPRTDPAADAAALAQALATARERCATAADEPAWRALLEELLLEVAPEDASLLGQLLRESRAAWALLWPRVTGAAAHANPGGAQDHEDPADAGGEASAALPPPPESIGDAMADALAGVPGRVDAGAPTALLVGDALAGTAPGLVRLGWRVCLVDPGDDPATADLARARGRATGTPVELLDEDDAAARTFDLVLVEEALGADDPRAARALGRARRLAARTADNRLAYKASSGHRADFRRTSPWTFLRRALGLDRDGGRATLASHRQRLARTVGAPADVRAAALYPDRRDFSHAVDLDRPGPALTLGPKERANRLKLAGYRAGLFPHLAPSFGLWAPVGRDGTEEPGALEGAGAPPAPDLAAAPRQLDLLLEDARRCLGAAGPTPTAEHLVATRGNSAVVLSRGASARAGDGPADGDWVLRVPLGHRAVVHGRANHAGVTWLRERFGDLPVPRPLGSVPAGGAAGLAVDVPVETRLDGLGAGQLSADPAAMGRLTGEVGALLAGLRTEAPAVVDEAAFDELFGRRFDEVRRRAAVPATIAALDRMRDEARAAVVGLAVPRVAAHNDLRPKHVIARVEGSDRERGRLVGLVDWSSLDPRGLPLYDLVHLIASERAQLPGSSPRRAWAEVRDPARLAPDERAALEAYERALDLPPAWRAAITAAYPVLFGAMAERNWDYSRPRWLRRLYGIGD